MLPEAVAALANMVEAALGVGAVDGERGREDHGLAPAAGGGRVLASVLAEAGAGELPLDRAAVRAGRGGREARVGVGADRGRGRGSGDLRPVLGYAGAQGVCAAGRSGVPGRGRRDLRAGGLEAGAVERRDAAAA